MIREHRPLHDWVRRYPMANKIANELGELLALRTRTLQHDIQSKYGCSACTARTAIGIARKAAA